MEKNKYSAPKALIRVLDIKDVIALSGYSSLDSIEQFDMTIGIDKL